MDVSKLRTGSAEIEKASRAKGGGKYTPFIYWKESKERKFLAFVTPIEEVPTLNVHPFVQTPNGKRFFVCRKNDFLLEDSGGACVLCDEHNEKPVTRNAAVAVVLEPVEEKVNGKKKITGFELKMRTFERKDGTEETVPEVGMVVQAASNFFMPLASFTTRKGDITDYPLEVERIGKDQKTSYQFYEYPDDMRPDLSEYKDEIPNIIDWISEKGSTEYYQSELDGYSGSDDGEEADPEAAGSGPDVSGDAFDSLVAGLRKKEQAGEAQEEAAAAS